MTSPIDMVGPSPVTSNGTETTEIDDDVPEDMEEDGPTPPRLPGSTDSQAAVCAAAEISLSLLY